MTKIDVIDTLKENGVFELTNEILCIIDADKAANHASANGDMKTLVKRIDGMQNWTQFGWRTMIDITDQVYGFTKYLAYSGIDACADIVDQVEELHDLLWNNFKNMEVWKG